MDPPQNNLLAVTFLPRGEWMLAGGVIQLTLLATALLPAFAHSLKRNKLINEKNASVIVIKVFCFLLATLFSHRHIEISFG